MASFQRLGNKRTSIQRIMIVNIMVLLFSILIWGVIGYLDIQTGKVALNQELEYINQDEQIWEKVEEIERLILEVENVQMLSKRLELAVGNLSAINAATGSDLERLNGDLKETIGLLKQFWPTYLEVQRLDDLWEEVEGVEKAMEEVLAQKTGDAGVLQAFRERLNSVQESSALLLEYQRQSLNTAQNRVRANSKLKTDHITTLGKLVIRLEHRFFASVLIISLLVIGLQAGFLILYKKRLRSLTAIASRISQNQNLSERVDWVSTDEIGLLVQSFNRMLERLQQSQEEVFASKSFLDNIIQSLQNGLLVVGLDGKIKNINPALLELLKVDKEELLARPLKTIFLDLPDEFYSLEEIDKSVSQALIQEKEHIFVRKDGTQITVLLSSSIIRDQSGAAEGIVCVVQDISNVKKMENRQRNLEEQLRQSQKMEAIGTLAGGIAHDFNNILSTMQGFTWLLMADKPMDSEERDYLEEIYQAGERAASLIQQILTFSRVDNQEMKPLKLAPLVKEALRFMRSTLPATLQIEQKISSDCGPILANPTQIHQIVINLCTNAVHAMRGRKGILEIGISCVDGNDHHLLQSEFPDRSFVRLKVSDTGKGMSNDDKKRIFEPFFTTKEVGEGTGLGLSVVHGIVKGHNGRIFVESELGRGTVFEVFFPVLTGDVGVNPEEEWLSPQKGEEHLMIVEDEASLSRYYEIALVRLGYKISIAENGRDALELYRMKQDQIDLVLTDQAMPGMSGTQLSQELLELNPDLPIILFTGYKSPKLQEEVEASGIAGFLGKPVNLGVLTQCIREVLGKNGNDPKSNKKLVLGQQELVTAGEIIQKDREFDEIVPIFIHERRQELIAIQEAVNNTSYEIIYSIGHKIQGAADVFGFTTVSQIGKTLKEAAMKNENELIQKKVNDLKIYLDQLEKDHNT